jgi:hypothetical protein
MQFEWDKSGKNESVEITLYDDEKDFKTIEAGKTEKNKIELDYEDIAGINFTDIAKYINYERDPLFTFEADELIITAKYTLGLISIKIEIEDLDLEDFEP